jgi:hypothetical protein
MFKFQAVLARTQPFLSRSVEKRGDQSNSNAEKWSIIMQFAVCVSRTVHTRVTRRSH